MDEAGKPELEWQGSAGRQTARGVRPRERSCHAPRGGKGRGRPRTGGPEIFKNTDREAFRNVSTLLAFGRSRHLLVDMHVPTELLRNAADTLLDSRVSHPCSDGERTAGSSVTCAASWNSFGCRRVLGLRQEARRHAACPTPARRPSSRSGPAGGAHAGCRSEVGPRKLITVSNTLKTLVSKHDPIRPKHRHDTDASACPWRVLPAPRRCLARGPRELRALEGAHGRVRGQERARRAFFGRAVPRASAAPGGRARSPRVRATDARPMVSWDRN